MYICTYIIFSFISLCMYVNIIVVYIFMYVGHLYEGEWKDNKRHGKGKITFRDMNYYEGAWLEGIVYI